MLDRQKVDGSGEQYAIAGMVYSSTVCGKMFSLPERFWETKAAKTLDELCCRCFEKSGKAPKDSIRAVARAWAEKGKDETLVKQVGELIERIESRFPDGKINSGHCIDEAMDFFNGVRVNQAIESAQGLVRLGKTKDAMQTLASLNEIEAGTSTGCDPFFDEAIADLLMADKPEPLVKIAGQLGQFYGHLLRRSSFVTFVAPEGVGKSQFLWDIAYVAMMQRLRVLYFQIGDMEKEEVLHRMMSRAAKHPWYSSRDESPRWPCEIDWPVKLDPDDMQFETLRFEKPFDRAKIKETQKAVQQQIRAKTGYLKLSSHANDSINLAGLEDVMRNYERSGFVADVLVIDYADNLLPPVGMGRAEPRDQINKTWSQLRGLTMRKSVLTVTATQCNRKGQDADVLQLKYLSEEKRKAAHVTAMFGINQKDPEEKSVGIYRLNIMKARNMHFNKFRCCYVAGCLDVSHPTVLSWYPTYVPPKEQK